MAGDVLLETGSAGIAVRIEIEGLQYEFCSDPGMVQTLGDGRSRIYALAEMGEGIVIEDSVNIPEAMLEANGCSVPIFETDDEEVAQAFWFLPDIERHLAATADVADTALTLYTTSGLNDGDILH